MGEIIESYIDRASVKSDTDFFIENLSRVLDAYNKLSNTKITLGNAQSSRQVVDALKLSNAQLAEAIKLNQADAKQAIATARAKTEEAKQRAANAKAATEEAKAQAAQQKAAETSSRAQQKAANDRAKADKEAERNARQLQKVEEELANEYLQLSKAANDASLKAKNYALTLGETNPVTIEAIKNAKAMNDVLKRVDASVGQYQRNVGNYKSAFDGLSVSFTQVARELPSLAVSPQTFFLAISNNLPMVADEISKAKTEIAALKAEGKDAPSLFERLTAATLSWQVGLAIGITLITTYGSKLIGFIANLFDANAATREAAEAQKRLNEETLESIRLNQQYDNTIKTDIGGTTRELENRLAYLKASGAAQKDILALELQIAKERQKAAAAAFNETGGAAQLDKLTKQLTEAKNALDEFIKAGGIESSNILGRRKVLGPDTEEFKTRKAQLQAQVDLLFEQYKIQRNITDEFYNANRDAIAKQLELEKGDKEKRVALFTGEIEYKIEQLKEFAAFDQLNESSRLAARKAAYEQELELAKLRRDDEIKNAEGSAAEIAVILRKYNLEKLKIENEFSRDALTIKQEYAAKVREQEQAITDDFNKQVAERNKAAIQAQVNDLNRRANYLQEARDLELNALEKRKSSLSDEEYQRERLKIEVKYAEQILREEIQFTENMIALAKARGEDVSDKERELAALKLRLSRETNRALEKDDEDYLKRKKQMLNELGSSTINLFSSVITGSFERQKNAIQDEIDALEERKQKEIEVANQTITNEQDKAARISVINARAAAEKTQLERKQRELDIQKAKFERAAAIARVVQETAINVVRYFKTPPLAVLAGVIGAVQIATILAQPIPRYKTGRKSGPAEMAIVGDGGVSEVITDSDGSNPRSTPAVDTLVSLKAGEKVFKSIEDYIANKPSRVPISSIRPVQPNPDSQMIGEIRSLKAAILGKQENHISLQDGEFKKSVKIGSAWVDYVNKNVFN